MEGYPSAAGDPANGVDERRREKSDRRDDDGGHRSSRRDGGEDRRERRGGEDRDRGERDDRDSRRDERRSRRSSRDREERGGGGGERRRSRDRGDRDRERGDREHRDRGERDRGDRERRRSRDRSPRRRRSESPGGGDDRRRRRSVTPIHLKKLKLNQWDVPPQGLEKYTPEQVKNMGIFPLPGGVSRTTGPAPGEARPTSAAAASPTSAVATPTMVLNPTMTRQARRLYVGNIPYGCTEDSLCGFFNNMITQLGMAIAGPGVPCIAAQINHEKNYAFAEFRSPEEASAAVTFDGVAFQNQSLKIRRPKDYAPPNGVDVQPLNAPPGLQLPQQQDQHPNKIYIGNIPHSLTEQNIRELFSTFGELKMCSLVTENGMSKGFAFAEFVDGSLTDGVCQQLNGFELVDRKLVVQRAGRPSAAASTGSNNIPLGSAAPLPSIIPQEALTQGPGDPTTVVMLLNMVTPEELYDEDEYMEILEDVSSEVKKFGRVSEVVMPRPLAGQDIKGVGKIFIRYEKPEEASAAVKMLAGRRFADRTVIAGFYDVERFRNGDY